MGSDASRAQVADELLERRGQTYADEVAADPGADILPREA